MDNLFEKYYQKLGRVQCNTKRSLLDEIDWTNRRA